MLLDLEAPGWCSCHTDAAACRRACSWLQGVWALPRKTAKVEPLMDGPASTGPAGRTASIAAWHASKVAAHLRVQDAGTRCISSGTSDAHNLGCVPQGVLPGMPVVLQS